MGRKSRHYRDESDPLLGLYSQTLAATTSTRTSNALYSSSAGGNSDVSPFRKKKSLNLDSEKLTSNSASKGYRVHRVSYTAHNHVDVLFQMYGSAFPQVLPFCLFNVMWTLVIHYLKAQEIIDLTFHSSIGHSFMGLLVSFLVVSRSKISYDRFMDFRRHLATTYRSCREIAQLVTCYTGFIQSPAAAQWRQDVCFRTILMLRATMDALLWSSTERDHWEEEYYCGDRHYSIVPNSHFGPPPPPFHHKGSNHTEETDPDEPFDTENVPSSISQHFWQFRNLTHGRRSMIDENFRAPITFGHLLRTTIMQHPEALGLRMPVNEYRDLVLLVGTFIEAFHGFRVLIFTPYPFPLVQMTRAFLFVWVYTLPMVLLKEYRVWSSLLIVLFVSFGFVGIEYVSMALDDPFGDETNDVDEHGMALLVYEDIYLALYRTDGYTAAVSLRERVLERYRQGRGLDCYRNDLEGYDLWETKYGQYSAPSEPAP